MWGRMQCWGQWARWAGLSPKTLMLQRRMTVLGLCCVLKHMPRRPHMISWCWRLENLCTCRGKAVM